jgi:plasmid maintenance system antidote protein VapI
MRRKRPIFHANRNDSNPYEKMTFSEALGTSAWQQHLADIRPFAFDLVKPTKSEDKAPEFAQIPQFVQDGDMDEQAIMSRFRDYLVCKELDSRAFPLPIPGLVLREFLVSLGKLDPIVWRNLGIDELIAVTHGKVPISFKLSKRLSDSFGTPTEFWSELQSEYDRLVPETNYNSEFELRDLVED